MGHNGGYIERNRNGYSGELNIDGIDVSPVTACFFKDRGKSWLWLKRKPVLEYEMELGTYKTRTPNPAWEAYLCQSKDKNGVAFRGTFVFFKFKYEIVGIWDEQFKSSDRLQLYVERLPSEQQTIINNIKKRRQENGT